MKEELEAASSEIKETKTRFNEKVKAKAEAKVEEAKDAIIKVNEKEAEFNEKKAKYEDEIKELKKAYAKCEDKVITEIHASCFKILIFIDC